MPRVRQLDRVEARLHSADATGRAASAGRGRRASAPSNRTPGATTAATASPSAPQSAASDGIRVRRLRGRLRRARRASAAGGGSTCSARRELDRLADHLREPLRAGGREVQPVGREPVAVPGAVGRPVDRRDLVGVRLLERAHEPAVRVGAAAERPSAGPASAARTGRPARAPVRAPAPLTRPVGAERHDDQVRQPASALITSRPCANVRHATASTAEAHLAEVVAGRHGDRVADDERRQRVLLVDLREDVLASRARGRARRAARSDADGEDEPRRA